MTRKTPTAAQESLSRPKPTAPAPSILTVPPPPSEETSSSSVPPIGSSMVSVNPLF